MARVKRRLRVFGILSVTSGGTPEFPRPGCEPAHIPNASSLPRAAPTRSVGADLQPAWEPPMIRRTGIVASLLTALIVAAPAARADDPVKDIIDHEVPALKDGTRIALPDVQAAILAACARRKFEASVVSP